MKSFTLTRRGPSRLGSCRPRNPSLNSGPRPALGGLRGGLGGGSPPTVKVCGGFEQARYNRECAATNLTAKVTNQFRDSCYNDCVSGITAREGLRPNTVSTSPLNHQCEISSRCTCYHLKTCCILDALVRTNPEMHPR